MSNEMPGVPAVELFDRYELMHDIAAIVLPVPNLMNEAPVKVAASDAARRTEIEATMRAGRDRYDGRDDGRRGGRGFPNRCGNGAVVALLELGTGPNFCRLCRLAQHRGKPVDLAR
jgi:hypothetical protein